MATRERESGDNVKEKRGISQVKQSRRHGAGSPSPSRSPSPSETKCVPNYLKATISSSPDAPTKPISSGKIKASVECTTTHNRPILSRRRSFDKPPSPTSQLHKTPHKPTTNTKERKFLVSSSSFKSAAKTTSHAPRPHLDRLSKASKAPPNLVTSPPNTVNKSSSTTTIKKQNVKTGNNPIGFADLTAKDDTQKIGKEDGPNPEPHQEGHESGRSEAAGGEDMSNFDNIKELPTEILTVEDKVQAELVQENDQSEDAVKLHEPPPVEQNDEAAVSAEVNERDANINTCEETEEDNSRFRDDSKIHPEESFAGETKLVNGTQKNEQVEEDEEVATENTKNKQLDDKDEVNVEIETAAEEVKGKPEMEKIQAGKGQTGQGMKKESAAYNDVIEETASKLREQRKNKVKALVGAFETVISLQEPEGNSPN